MNKKQFINNTYERSALIQKILVKTNNPLSIIQELIALATGKDISAETLRLCKQMVEQSVTWDVPWPKSKVYSDFQNIHGAAYRNSNKRVSGCYMLDDGEGHTYVGQSKHLASRIRDHIILNYTTTSTIKMRNTTAKVTTYIITEEVMLILVNLHVNPITFLFILEQYLLLIYQPTVNKVLISTIGGQEVSIAGREKYSKEERTRVNSKRMPVHYYVLNKTTIQFSHIHTLLSQNSLGKALGKGSGYLRFVMQEQRG